MAQQPAGQNAAQPFVTYMVAQQGALHAAGGNQMLPQIHVPPVVNIPRKYSEKDAKKTTAMGVVQLVAGCLCIVFQAAATSIGPRTDRYFRSSSLYGVDSAGGGIWCGIMFLISGILGICAGKKNKLGLIIASMVFNILCSILGWVLLGLASANLSMLSGCRNDGKSDWQYTYNSYYTGYYSGSIGYYSGTQYYKYYCFNSLFDAWMAMDVLLIILALMEIAVAIAASAYCCKATGCCCSQATPQYVVHQTYLPASVCVQGLSAQPAMAVPYGYVSQGYPIGMNVQHPAATAANATYFTGGVVNAPPYETLHAASAAAPDGATSHSDLAANSGIASQNVPNLPANASGFAYAPMAMYGDATHAPPKYEETQSKL